jgi:hypothetical protein
MDAPPENEMKRLNSSYQKVYYGNTQFKNLLSLSMFLGHIIDKFSASLLSLKPNDRKCPIILSILKKHFPEIEIHDFNILICQHAATEDFYVYFSGNYLSPRIRF